MRHRTITILAGVLLLGAPIQARAQERGGRGHGADEERERSLVAEGVRIWTWRCIRCHNVRPVRERTDRRWTTIMLHMRVRANLTEHQTEAVLAFLRAVNEPVADDEEGMEPADVPDCPAPTPERAAEGAEVYRGVGNCVGCHGADGRWSRISGEFSEIVRVVTLGTPGMPPMGGAELTDREICAVSAYVYSISR